MDKIDKLVKRMKEDEKEYNNFWISSQRIHEKELKQGTKEKIRVTSLTYFDSINEETLDLSQYDITSLKPLEEDDILKFFDLRKNKRVRKLLSYNEQITIHLLMLMHPAEGYDNELNDKNYRDLCNNWLSYAYDVIRDMDLKEESYHPFFTSNDILRINRKLMEKHQYQFAGFTTEYVNQLIKIMYASLTNYIKLLNRKELSKEMLKEIVRDLKVNFGKFPQPKYK